MSVVVIGNFDGVHLGHRDVILCAVNEARRLHTDVYALTFRNNPKNFLLGRDTVKLIVSDCEKERLILNLGAGHVVFQNFDSAFSSMTAEAYVRMLKKEYSCSTIVCGCNFRLGKNAACDAEGLAYVAKEIGVNVISVPMRMTEDGECISSTRIRSLVESGDVKGASSMLGRLFSVFSEVSHGRHIGTGLGLPTANQVFPDSQLLPLNGVYASYAQCGNSLWRAVTNIGVAPTVSDAGKTIAETHFISLVHGSDDSLSLYGKKIRVGFAGYLRPEQQFSGLEELKAHIVTDVQNSSVIFSHFDEEFLRI